MCVSTEQYISGNVHILHVSFYTERLLTYAEAINCSNYLVPLTTHTCACIGSQVKDSTGPERSATLNFHHCDSGIFGILA